MRHDGGVRWSLGPSLRRHPEAFHLYMGLFVSAISLVAGILARSVAVLLWGVILAGVFSLGLWFTFRRD
jgi:hypothetical protein